MRRATLATLAAAVLAASAAAGWAQVAAAAPGGAASAAAPALAASIQDLGQGRYRIGSIEVDRQVRRFTVSGRVLVTGKPLEYLATSPGGMKAYEAMLELDTGGTAFNLACILIGLERDRGMPAAMRLGDAKALPGAPLSITLAWQAGGERIQVDAAQALLNPEAGVDPAGVRWVYTGAPAADGQPRFSPDDTGTLIGFVHDANSIIEASVGIGIGAYGSVRGHAMLPPVGTPVELTVAAGRAAR